MSNLINTKEIIEYINSKEEYFIDYINEIQYNVDCDGELSISSFQIHFNDMYLFVQRDKETREEIYIGVECCEYGKQALSMSEAAIINKAFKFYDFFSYLIFELKDDIFDLHNNDYLETKDFLKLINYIDKKPNK